MFPESLIQLTDSLKSLYINTCKKLKGSDRRQFMAEVVKGLGRGGQVIAERELGWNRRTIRKGMQESGRPHHVNKETLLRIELKSMSLSFAYCENFRRSLWGLKNNQARNPDFFVGS